MTAELMHAIVIVLVAFVCLRSAMRLIWAVGRVAFDALLFAGSLWLLSVLF